MQPQAMKERAADAYSRCNFVLELLQEQITIGAQGLAVQMLETAANYLELLVDHPFFQPGADREQAAYQDALNRITFMLHCKKRYTPRYARRLIQEFCPGETILG
jgi:hypothetical protein